VRVRACVLMQHTSNNTTAAARLQAHKHGRPSMRACRPPKQKQDGVAQARLRMQQLRVCLPNAHAHTP